MLFVSAVNESAETSVGASGKNHLLIHVIVTVWHWGFNLGHSSRETSSISKVCSSPYYLFLRSSKTKITSVCEAPLLQQPEVRDYTLEYCKY